MSHQALTLQYRPIDFETIVGQDHITSVLREQVKADTMKASYLFFGPRGTGKTSSARIITKAVNCLDLRDGNPCNNCVNCVAINANTTLDVVEIDAASHTGVDNVREEIIAKAGYKPTQLKRKVYIIDEVHMLSKGAFNALLKIMEEPPAYVMFILATTELHKVPDTILSRCQLFQYSRVDEKSMVSRLRTIVDMESLVADDAALKLIAKASGGIMRDAVKYLDQAHILGDITVDTIQSLLGLVDDSTLNDMLDHIRAGEMVVLDLIQRLYDEGVDVIQLAQQMLSYVDNRFTEDVVFMSRMVGIFGEIVREVHYYPTPVLAYKKVLADELLSFSQHASPTTIPSPMEADEVKKQSSISTDGSASVTPSNSANELKEQLIERLSSESFGKILRSHVMIERTSDDIITLTSINKIASIKLEKDTIQQEVETILSELCGCTVRIRLVTMTKEEYAASLVA